MATMPLFISISLFLFIPYTTTARKSNQICERTSCGNGPYIQFPFRLREANQSDRCGYPGFELSCNRNQTLLTLSDDGEFEVIEISSAYQKVSINDPHNCLPKRFMQKNDLTAGSPFRFSDIYYSHIVNLTFLNCSNNVMKTALLYQIHCPGTINNDEYTVGAFPSDAFNSTEWNSWCQVISWSLVPVRYTSRPVFFSGLYDDIQLQWDEPNCGDCEERGGNCGFSGDTGLEVACYLPGQGEGLPRRAKYGIALGLGIPGGLCIIGMVWLCSGNMINRERRQETIESTTLQLSPVSMGLERNIIEKYPKTELGESGRLPNPNDNVCSICLCEYQPKETLRTIPECNHYFHLNCVDGWLRINAACPLCRKLPDIETFSLGTSLPQSLHSPLVLLYSLCLFHMDENCIKYSI